MSTRVLVVEDEADIRNLLVLNLRRAGFEVLAAEDGATGLELLAAHRPPVVLLDLMLPDMNGHEVCEKIRGNPDTARTFVIMVTALTEEEDRIAGFQVGADDYVTKPFSLKELVLRVQVAARRADQGKAEVEPEPQETEVNHGCLRIDKAAHRVWVHEETVELTATEYRLVVYLVENPDKLCERGELLEKVWELPPHLNTRTVDTHIKRLRFKLGDASSYVETVRGAGYRFTGGE
ncbi:MAG: response regulator transcription factor [Myxococcota bacterium]|nr:response regulator transcription factor [Myxococcota bacterium]